jgi:hypothetical protein
MENFNDKWIVHTRTDELHIGARIVICILAVFAAFLALATSWHRSEEENVPTPTFQNIEKERIVP